MCVAEVYRLCGRELTTCTALIPPRPYVYRMCVGCVPPRSTTPMGTSKDIPAALQPCTPMSQEADFVAYEADIFGNFQGVVQV